MHTVTMLPLNLIAIAAFQFLCRVDYSLFDMLFDMHAR